MLQVRPWNANSLVISKEYIFYRWIVTFITDQKNSLGHIQKCQNLPCTFWWFFHTRNFQEIWGKCLPPHWHFSHLELNSFSTYRSFLWTPGSFSEYIWCLRPLSPPWRWCWCLLGKDCRSCKPAPSACPAHVPTASPPGYTGQTQQRLEHIWREGFEPVVELALPCCPLAVRGEGGILGWSSSSTYHGHCQEGLQQFCPCRRRQVSQMGAWMKKWEGIINGLIDKNPHCCGIIKKFRIFKRVITFLSRDSWHCRAGGNFEEFLKKVLGSDPSPGSVGFSWFSSETAPSIRPRCWRHTSMMLMQTWRHCTRQTYAPGWWSIPRGLSGAEDPSLQRQDHVSCNLPWVQLDAATFSPLLLYTSFLLWHHLLACCLQQEWYLPGALVCQTCVSTGVLFGGSPLLSTSIERRYLSTR